MYRNCGKWKVVFLIIVLVHQKKKRCFTIEMLTWLLSIVHSSFHHSISLKMYMRHICIYVSDPMISSQSIHWYVYCSKLISCNGNPLWLLYKFEKLCKHIYFTYIHMGPPLLENCNSIYQSTLKQVEEILYRKTY